MTNFDNPILRVRHSELASDVEWSLYRRKCPLCKYGFLLMHRDDETLELLPIDHCILCAQAFEYVDIELIGR